MIASEMPTQAHIQDDDLEKYFLGMIPDQNQLEQIETHLLVCSLCALKADWTREYVLTMKDSLQRLHDADGSSSDD